MTNIVSFLYQPSFPSQRLPFSQTRHLRNSWNNNREVKVSRDGTELETTVGEMLMQGFHWAEQQQLYQQQQQQQPQQAPPPPPYQPMMYNNEMPQQSQQMMMGYIQTPHGLQLVPIPFVGLGMPPNPYPYMLGEFSTQDDAQ
jgi:YT521-B-like domain